MEQVLEIIAERMIVLLLLKDYKVLKKKSKQKLLKQAVISKAMTKSMKQL